MRELILASAVALGAALISAGLLRIGFELLKELRQ